MNSPHYDAYTDEAVLQESRRDPNVFAVLVSRYEDSFLRRAEQVLKSREDAEEVVVDAFARIYQYSHKFVPTEGATFRSWAYKILMNTAFTRYERLRRDRAHRAEVEPEWYEAMPDREMNQFASGETREYVISVLARMPESLSRVLRLYFIDGLPQRQIAEMEGTTVGAIKTRMHRAKAEFRELLKHMSV